MTERITTIQIKSDTWKSLMNMKSLGETMDDVIKRIINNVKLQDPTKLSDFEGMEDEK